MTHQIGIVEGYHDSVFKFLNFWHGKEYANGAKVRVRIALPVIFAINERGNKEFLMDLKSFTAYQENLAHNEGGPGVKNKLLGIFKWVRRLFRDIKEVDFNQIQDSKLCQKEMEKGNHFLMNYYPLGEVKDLRNPDGSEIV